MSYLRDGGRYRARRHSCFIQHVENQDEARDHRRSEPTGNPPRTTRCTAASSAGSSPSSPSLTPGAGLDNACCVDSATGSPKLTAERALVHRGAPVSHRHRGAASDDPRPRARTAMASTTSPVHPRGRHAFVKGGETRVFQAGWATPACVSPCSSPGPRCCSTKRNHPRDHAHPAQMASSACATRSS